jgi:hypothetical protein
MLTAATTTAEVKHRFGVGAHYWTTNDINANYRFEEWDSIKTLDEDASSDTITLGAAVRIEL